MSEKKDKLLVSLLREGISKLGYSYVTGLNDIITIFEFWKGSKGVQKVKEYFLVEETRFVPSIYPQVVVAAKLHKKILKDYFLSCLNQASFRGGNKIL